MEKDEDIQNNVCKIPNIPLKTSSTLLIKRGNTHKYFLGKKIKSLKLQRVQI